MQAVLHPLLDRHRAGDELLLALESSLVSPGARNFIDQVKALADELEGHFQLEDSTLFPAFEAATGITAGPTAVMRAEHVQMRELLADMLASATAGTRDELIAQASMLAMLMGQHNLKEENVLYPMCARYLNPAELTAIVAGRPMAGLEAA